MIVAMCEAVTSDDDRCPIEPSKRKMEILIKGCSLLLKDPDRDLLTKHYRACIVCAPMHSCRITSQSNVGRKLVQLAADGQSGRRRAWGWLKGIASSSRHLRIRDGK